MAIPNQTPYNIFTANGISTVFPYEFYLLNTFDLTVSINGSELTSGFTISGIGNVDGGEVTFLTPPANGSVVLLERVVPTYRLTEYQDNGDLLAETVNKDFDRLWMAIQQAFIYLGLALTRPLLGGPFNAHGYRIENLGDPVNPQDAVTKKWFIEQNATSLARTLRVPENSVSPVPPVGMRKNKLLAFNDAGNPITVLPESGSAADVMVEFAKPTGAKLSGYRAYTVHDRLDVMLTTGAMGAIGDGVADDTAAVQLAIDTLATFTKSASLYLEGRCKVSGLTIPPTLSLTIIGNNPGGASYDKSALIFTNTTGASIEVKGSACAFVDFQMIGSSSDVAGGSDTTQTALLFNPGIENGYNCDAHVSGVGFLFFNKINDLRGRNLKLTNCTFSNSAWVVWIGTIGIPDFRGLDIKNCRFHYVAASAGSVASPLQASAIFIDPETKFFSTHISGCYCDGGKWFYVGSMAWASISACHLSAQQGGAFYVYNTSPSIGSIFQKGVIQACTINGTNTANIANNLGSITVASGWGIDIVGNVINNAFKHGVYNEVSNTVISDNTIKNASFTVNDGYYIFNSGNNTQILNNRVINLGQGLGTPAAAIRLETFTIVDGNRFAGVFAQIWDISSRGETLVYGEMKIPSAVSIEYGISAPTSGRYLRGSIVYNTLPSAGGLPGGLPGGYLGWVCIGSGTPGVWKGFGGIET
ncbi:phage tail fiber domain-containing protein [Serratia fonticola]|uniref:phage tail fiber domain-containing protein n=1 Tax=Serratia fonticola TaxID=47917 RepID=UPI0004240DE3|nr:phage tail fiber protein [Serratia fonticola]